MVNEVLNERLNMYTKKLFIVLVLCLVSQQIYSMEGSFETWVKDEIKAINSSISEIKNHLSIINQKLDLNAEAHNKPTENLKQVKPIQHTTPTIAIKPLVSTNVEEIKTKLDNLIKRSETNNELAHNLYNALQELAKSFWIIGNFPKKGSQLIKTEEFIQLLRKGEDRIISFLTNIGHETDEKEVLDALNKIES